MGAGAAALGRGRGAEASWEALRLMPEVSVWFRGWSTGIVGCRDGLCGDGLGLSRRLWAELRRRRGVRGLPEETALRRVQEAEEERAGTDLLGLR